MEFKNRKQAELEAKREQNKRMKEINKLNLMMKQEEKKD